MVALAAALSACAPRRAALAARPPAAAKAVSEEDRKEASREYYLAVSSYLAEDYAATRAHLRRVDLLDPGYPAAKALAAKIKAAERASLGGH